MNPASAGFATAGMPSTSTARWKLVAGAEVADRGLGIGDPVGGRQAVLAKDVLGEALVHAALAGGDPGSRVRDAHEFEERLDGSVFAFGPVEGDEGHVGPRLRQP